MIFFNLGTIEKYEGKMVSRVDEVTCLLLFRQPGNMCGQEVFSFSTCGTVPQCLVKGPVTALNRFQRMKAQIPRSASGQLDVQHISL
jgi:hypothetical protein